MAGTSIEPSPLGRIVVPDDLLPGTALFWTTADFDGRLTAESVPALEEILVAFGLGGPIATCDQVHGSTVNRLGAIADRWCEYSSCDALWTDTRPAALGIKAADCLPITIIDPHNGVIANAHMGWRGAVAGVLGSLLGSLDDAEELSAMHATAFLGPSIRRCCFEVGEEVIVAFEERYGNVDGLVDRDRGPRPFFDLPGLARRLLLESGIQAETTFDSELCTRCDGSIFHSYRRDGKNAGRNLAIVSQ